MHFLEEGFIALHNRRNNQAHAPLFKLGIAVANAFFVDDFHAL